LLKRVYCKKGGRFSRPQLGDVTNQTLSLDGKNLIIPAKECVVIDIPAGDGKIVHLFLKCIDYGCTEGLQKYVGLNRATKYVHAGRGELRNKLYFTFPGQRNQEVKMLQPSV
jgi:hypothetical protein